MTRLAGAFGVMVMLILLVNLVIPGKLPFGSDQIAQAQIALPEAALQASVAPQHTGPPPEQLPPAVDAVLRSGVLIVVSKASQRMYVFKDGVPWASSPVSTGKRGHSTPAGVFPILQKRVHHRSNIYSNAPMPYMQRLTWRGVAIHAGRLPGYPASHGCIRLPYAFARALFGLTKAANTTVVVMNEAVRTNEAAVTLALNMQRPQPVLPGIAPQVKLAVAQPTPPAPAPVAGEGQTIQLAAAQTAGEAEAHWLALVAAHPELAGFRKTVIPAVVGSRQFYRLRASAPGASAYCAALKRAGTDCFTIS